MIKWVRETMAGSNPWYRSTDGRFTITKRSKPVWGGDKAYYLLRDHHTSTELEYNTLREAKADGARQLFKRWMAGG